MNEPTDFELIELATPYALHAMSDEETADIERRLATAPASVAAAFYDEARAVRETLAVVSAETMAEPPEHLRAAVLAAVVPTIATVRRSRWRTTVLASAAAIAIGLGAFGVGVVMRPSPTQTVAEQVLGAPDVQT